jgi:hypothetical protein
MEVEVKYINRHKGRGVFAKRDFFEKEIVYLEKPLSCHRNVDLAKVQGSTGKEGEKKAAKG